MSTSKSSPRREFLQSLAAGAAGIGLFSSIPQSVAAIPWGTKDPNSDLDAWFAGINGKHRMVFDATQPHETMPFAWPKVFLMTNEKTGTPPKECSAVVVLRHSAVGYALDDKLWEKYKLGEVFKANDPLTGKPALRNPFQHPKPGDFSVPGIGNVAIGINELQAEGVKFCACDVALTVFSAVIGQMVKQDGGEIKKEWLAGILPGIMVVPSGVWAVNRAQEHGCSYVFAG